MSILKKLYHRLKIKIKTTETNQKKIKTTEMKGGKKTKVDTERRYADK